MNVLTAEQVEFVATAMREQNQSLENIYEYMWSATTKDLSMSKEEYDSYCFGFMKGFIASTEISKYIVNHLIILRGGKVMNNLLALEVTGDAMEPSILEGAVLFVDPNQVPAANAKDIAVFKIGESFHVCRFTNFGRNLLLIHDNGTITPVKKHMAELVGMVVKHDDFSVINNENCSAVNTTVSEAFAI